MDWAGERFAERVCGEVLDFLILVLGLTAGCEGVR